MSDHEWLIRRLTLSACADSKEPALPGRAQRNYICRGDGIVRAADEKRTKEEHMRLAAVNAYCAARRKIPTSASALSNRSLLLGARVNEWRGVQQLPGVSKDELEHLPKSRVPRMHQSEFEEGRT